MQYPRTPEPPRKALLRAALAALQEGNFAEAERYAADCLHDAPKDVEATLMRGLALAASGEPILAAPLLHEVALARTGFAHPCRDLAQFQPDAPARTAATFRACRALAPHDERLGYAYADFLLDNGRPAAAAAVLREILRTDTQFSPAYNLFGMALLELGEPNGAIAAFRHATKLTPDEAATWANLGMALKVQDRFDEALSAYDAAIRRAPEDAQIRLNRAVALLRAGRMAEAWPDYESRLALGRGPRLPMQRLLPTLGPYENLTGRTVLAWHEEGFGDTLQFARYVPLLAERGARVLVYVPPQLARLMRTLPGVEAVHTSPEAPPPFAFHVPFFSMPRVFATTLDSIPADLPYLAADAAAVADWAGRLPRAGLRVGLAWAGQARPWAPGFVGLDQRRSMDLLTLAPLARVPGVTLVSLQKGPAAGQALTLPSDLEIVDPMPEVQDFADTAAIIANLDIVVSVDTSVVHLAGALGKPAILLDRYDNCWRWLAGREDSPWYPQLRIFRQKRMGDWAPVVERTAAALAKLAAARQR